MISNNKLVTFALCLASLLVVAQALKPDEDRLVLKPQSISLLDINTTIVGPQDAVVDESKPPRRVDIPFTIQVVDTSSNETKVIKPGENDTKVNDAGKPNERPVNRPNGKSDSVVVLPTKVVLILTTMSTLLMAKLRNSAMVHSS